MIEVNNRKRPIIVCEPHQLAWVPVWMREVQHIRRLRVLDRVQACGKVRGNNLVRNRSNGGRRYRSSKHLPAILVHPHVLVAKLEDVSLLSPKLKRNQTGYIRRVLDLVYKPSAAALTRSTLNEWVEILHLRTAVLILRQVNATVECGTKLARVE